MQKNDGILYLVATPIGNLADMTHRAVQILREVDVVAAEDTRHAAILFRHYGITTPCVSYYEQNEMSRSAELLKRLEQGTKVALITDAGTPTISDPGFRLVQQAVRSGIRIVPVPGASALLAALVAAGLPTDHFLFEGFLPRKKGRQKRLSFLSAFPHTIVLYESPFRLLATLTDLQQHCGEERSAVVTRELTKVFEEFRRGTLAGLISYYREHEPRGECVIVLAGSTYRGESQSDEQ